VDPIFPAAEPDFPVMAAVDSLAMAAVVSPVAADLGVAVPEAIPNL